LDQLLEIWDDEARREFENERDTANSEAILAGRVHSGFHTQELARGAERVALALISKAKSVPLPKHEWGRLEAFAIIIFDRMANEIKQITAGLGGRAPKLEAIEEVSRLLVPFQKAVVNEFTKMRITEQLSIDYEVTQPEVRVTSAKAGRSQPDNRIIEQVDEVEPLKLTDLSDAKLRFWFSALTASQEVLSQNDLWQLCKSAFPKNKIARQRIRDLTPNRKRGPRPIRP
jgi:predicted DNA-binding protein (UPF0251 family)